MWGGIVKHATVLILSVGIMVGIPLGMIIVSKVPDALTFLSQVISAIVWPGLLFLLLCVTFRENIRTLLNRVKNIKTPWGEVQLADVRDVDRKLRDVSVPDAEIPPITESLTSALTAKQRIIDGWRAIHETLADIYTDSTGKTPPRAYKALANRLKRGNILTDKRVWDLVDTVRRIYRETVRVPQSQVSPALADYYERVVPLVRAAIDNTREPRRRES